jgi:hypothetical protein
MTAANYAALSNIFSMVFAYAAALLWYVSAAVKVKILPEGQSHGHPEIDVNGIAFIASATRQARWSRRAAMAAATAALFQGFAILATLM